MTNLASDGSNERRPRQDRDARRSSNAPQPDLRLVAAPELTSRGGVREEVVQRFLVAPSDNTCLGKLGLLLEGVETDGQALWRIGALALAALQRLAHDQAEIFIGVLSGSRTEGSHDAGAAGAGVFAGLAAAAEIVVESHLELSEIAADRARSWSDISRGLLGGADDALGLFSRS